MSAAPTETRSTAAETSSRPGWRPRGLLPWLVALAAIGLAVFSTLQWRALAAEDATRAEVEAAAGTFLLELTTWDASDGLGETRDRLAELGSGEFLDEVEELFSSERTAELQNAGATSQGEVHDLFLQRIEGDRAVVFAVVLQTQDTDQTEPDTVPRSARVVLERVDGTWKVSRVEMVDAGTGTLSDVTSDAEETP